MTYNIFLRSGTAPWDISVITSSNDSQARFLDAATSSKRIMAKRRDFKTIQNTPFQQHTIFSNTEMLWVGFLFLFLYNFFYNTFFSIEKFIILRVKYFIPNYCIYRNVIPQNLNSLLRLVVAVWTFAVWFQIADQIVFLTFKTYTNL